jgi:hypothetical protein
MKIVDYKCTGCEGGGEILLRGQEVTPEELAGEPAEQWIAFDANGVLRCRECGSEVEIQAWRGASRHYRYYHNDSPSFDGMVQERDV